MKTVGMWPQKLASSTECVKTHRSNRAVSKMDGASSVDRSFAVGPEPSCIRRLIGRRVGWRRGPRRRSFARTAGAAACAYRGGSSFNFGRTRRAVVEKVSDRSANEIGSVAPKSRTRVRTQCFARSVRRKGSRPIFRHLAVPSEVARGLRVSVSRSTPSATVSGSKTFPVAPASVL